MPQGRLDGVGWFDGTETLVVEIEHGNGTRYIAVPLTRLQCRHLGRRFAEYKEITENLGGLET